MLARHGYFCLASALMFASNMSFCAAQVIPYISEKKATYLAIEVPGALGTYPMALNDSMTVTGYYLVSPTAARAFIQKSNGATTTFSVPNAAWTEPESINSAGDITGYFGANAKAPQAFLRYANGRLITFHPPAADGDFAQALPVAINDFDEIAGNTLVIDFARSRTGEFTNPGYVVNTGMMLSSLNESGTFVGYVGASDYTSFVLHPDGYYEQFDVPQDYNYCDESTLATSINAGGTIAGWWNETAWAPVPEPDCAGNSISGGFVRSPDGQLTLFDTPGPIVTSLNRPYDGNDIVGELSTPVTLTINREGIVTGSYTDATPNQHGFVRETDGNIISFDPPRGRHTTATGINASGVITGSYFYDWNAQASIGFLRIPTH